jgi:hypothetical protein
MAPACWPLQKAGEIGMTERIKSILDAVTERVFAYRPKDKGLAAKKAARRVKHAAKKEAHDDRESSI